MVERYLKGLEGPWYDALGLQLPVDNGGDLVSEGYYLLICQQENSPFIVIEPRSNQQQTRIEFEYMRILTFQQKTSHAIQILISREINSRKFVDSQLLVWI